MAARRRHRSLVDQSETSTLRLLNRRKVLPAGLLLIFLLLLAQMVGYAATVPSSLQYFRGFLVTGNYAVGSVDLTEDVNPPDLEGLSTGTINMSGVPKDAEIIAAYLYWEAITFTSNPAQARVKFRGQEIPIGDVLAVKKASQSLQGSTATCWSSGTPLTMFQYRADVLRFLPLRLDKDNEPTGIRLVTDADLQEQGLPLHTVTLPTRNGNQIPESGGASLVVVYRDPNPNEPLRKVVFYDGIHIQSDLTEATTLTLRGFYQSSSTKSAKITQLLGSGQPNNNERVFFNGVQKSPFNPVSIGTSSQRGWSALTYDVSQQMSPIATGSIVPGGYGESVTTTVDHSGGGGYDCLAWGAVIFSTAVADKDGDGVPDGLEDVSGGLKDPDNTPLPNLKAMGGGSDQADMFLEVNAMSAEPGTVYGSATAPFDSTDLTHPTRTDVNGHTHMPTPEMIKMLGDSYAVHGIRLHVDVGDLDEYHALGTITHSDWVDDYTSDDANAFLIGNGVGTNVATLARGGEQITERACDPTESNCRFPAYPGTVSWKLGMQLHRAWPVDDDGHEFSLDPSAPDFFDWNAPSAQHRVRFDPGREGLFHYLLFAHARAKPKSLPCLFKNHPRDYDANNGTSCVTANPFFNPLDYHVPSSTSGVADLPGNSSLVTLGMWEEFVARPFVRASTTFHELGHNLGLWHGGLPAGGISAVWGNKGLGLPTSFEANCKPNYLSSMSYLYQVHGLFSDDDEIHLDYSTTVNGGSSETALADAALSPTPNYQPAWFAPVGSQLAVTLGVSAAKRFCGGAVGAPQNSMARVHTLLSGAYIDWDGDLTQDPSSAPQDVNFDGPPLTSVTFTGYDDWSNIRLNQVGTAAAGILPGSIEGSIDFAGGSIDYAGGSIDFAGGSIDFAGGSIDYAGGSIDYAGGSIDFAGGSIDFAGGSIDFAGGSIDFAGGSIDFAGGQEEVTRNLANELGKSRPHEVNACVIGRDASCETTASPFSGLYHRVEVKFKPSPFGSFVNYQVQRKRDGAADSTFATVGTTTTNLFVDTTELADTVKYVYRVRGKATDGDSEWSRPASPVTAANDAPQAMGEGPFTVDNKSTIPFSIASLVANDSDDDSPTPFTARRVIVTLQPAHGTLTLNAAGTILTYKPTKNYVGPDSFKYRVDDGDTSDTPVVPLSAQSNEITISINVVK